MTTESGKRSKLEKLIAVYERFGQEIESVPDPWASRLAQQSNAVRATVERTLGREFGATRSQFAAGLEQGLRDTSDFIALISPEWRVQVAKAFNHAVQTDYPEFIAKDAGRLEKILTRGKIRTESEYHLIRHRIDVLEGSSNADLLAELYKLADSFGSKV